MKIAIQGVAGAFHHQAAMEVAQGEEVEIVPCSTFREVFGAVLADEVPYGICAVENTLYGAINEVSQLLERHDVWVVKDVRLHIAQNLFSHQPITVEELRKDRNLRVISQAPALAQIEKWLGQNLPNATLEESHDTAASVRTVMQLKDSSLVAVAGVAAGELYGAHFVERSIQDNQENYTRFILFQKDKTDNPLATHTSLILKAEDKPHALLEILQVFSDNNCDISRLYSHPNASKDPSYMFYLDFPIQEGHDGMIRELERIGSDVRILGNYVHVPMLDGTF